MHDGLHFVPLDVFLDEKFELIEAQFGLKGFAIVIKLLQRIYSHGFYCEWTKDIALLFARRSGADFNFVSDIVSACVKRELFSKVMYERYGILTSRGIQKRYFDAVSRRKRLTVEKKYLLLTVEEYPFLKNVCKNEKNVDIFPENACSPEEKGREEKGRELKGKEGKGSAPARNPLTVPAAVTDALQKAGIAVTTLTVDKLCSWLTDTEEGVILYAIKEADAQNKRSIRYIEGILRNLKQDGISTVAQLDKRRRKKYSDKDTSVYKLPPDMDFDEIERRMNEKY